MDNNPKFNKDGGFGQVYFGEVDGTLARIRKLIVNDISTFQLREIPNELKKWRKISIPSVEAYLTEYHTLDEYYIVSEAHPNMSSLQDILYNKSNLTLHQKSNIIKSTAKTMLQLHALGDDFSHGHLSPSNILVPPFFIQVDHSFSSIVITDFGFHNLKTYCAMLTDYSNKDQYTAPELLKQKGRVIKKSTHAGDVYSLGMIL